MSFENKKDAQDAQDSKSSEENITTTTKLLIATTPESNPIPEPTVVEHKRRYVVVDWMGYNHATETYEVPQQDSCY